jgi:hypothetical protein
MKLVTLLVAAEMRQPENTTVTPPLHRHKLFQISGALCLTKEFTSDLIMPKLGDALCGPKQNSFIQLQSMFLLMSRSRTPGWQQHPDP